jgi:lipooligosaccharide transport system ATP-binding protein
MSGKSWRAAADREDDASSHNALSWTSERLCDPFSKIIDSTRRTLGRGRRRIELIAAHIEPEVVEIYGEGVDAWLEEHGRALATRAELHGETAFCYLRDPAPMIEKPS